MITLLLHLLATTRSDLQEFYAQNCCDDPCAIYTPDPLGNPAGRFSCKSLKSYVHEAGCCKQGSNCSITLEDDDYKNLKFPATCPQPLWFRTPALPGMLLGKSLQTESSGADNSAVADLIVGDASTLQTFHQSYNKTIYELMFGYPWDGVLDAEWAYLPGFSGVAFGAWRLTPPYKSMVYLHQWPQLDITEEFSDVPIPLDDHVRELNGAKRVDYLPIWFGPERPAPNHYRGDRILHDDTYFYFSFSTWGTNQFPGKLGIGRSNRQQSRSFELLYDSGWPGVVDMEWDTMDPEYIVYTSADMNLQEYADNPDYVTNRTSAIKRMRKDGTQDEIIVDTDTTVIPPVPFSTLIVKLQTYKHYVVFATNPGTIDPKKTAESMAADGKEFETKLYCYNRQTGELVLLLTHDSFDYINFIEVTDTQLFFGSGQSSIGSRLIVCDWVPGVSLQVTHQLVISQPPPAVTEMKFWGAKMAEFMGRQTLILGVNRCIAFYDVATNEIRMSKPLVKGVMWTVVPNTVDDSLWFASNRHFHSLSLDGEGMSFTSMYRWVDPSLAPTYDEIKDTETWKYEQIDLPTVGAGVRELWLADDEGASLLAKGAIEKVEPEPISSVPTWRSVHEDLIWQNNPRKWTADGVVWAETKGVLVVSGMAVTIADKVALGVSNTLALTKYTEAYRFTIAGASLVGGFTRASEIINEGQMQTFSILGVTLEQAIAFGFIE